MLRTSTEQQVMSGLLTALVIGLLGEDATVLASLVALATLGTIKLLDLAPTRERPRAGRHAKPLIVPRGVLGYVWILPLCCVLIAGVIVVSRLNMVNPPVAGAVLVGMAYPILAVPGRPQR